jgi:hypothetical protein
MVTSTRNKPMKAASVPASAKKERAPNSTLMSQTAIATPPRSIRCSTAPPPVTPVAASSPDPNLQLDSADFFKKDTSTTSSAPKFDFASFGIAVKPATASMSATRDKGSSLRLAIIPDTALVFRLQPNDPNVVPWAEKVFSDEIVSSQWTKELNIEMRPRKWFENDKPMVNSRGWGIRLFIIHVESTNIAIETLVALATHIASTLNAIPANNTVVTVSNDKEDFLWFERATWQELLGTEEALRKLRFDTGEMFCKGYYQKFTKAIHTYFRKGTFTIDLACTLHAPMDCIDPKFLKAASKTTKLAARKSSQVHVSDDSSFAPGFTLAPNDDDVINLHQPDTTSEQDSGEDEDM